MAVDVKCKECSKTFKVRESRVKKGTVKFCSKKCFYKNRKGTTRPPFSKEWCQNISKAVRKEKHYKWKGQWLSKGYVYIYKPDHKYCDKKGFVSEHRFIMEQHIGRPIEPLEEVHHINNIRNDNRIENLKLFKNNSEHSKFHYPKGKPFGTFNPLRPRDALGRFI